MCYDVKCDQFQNFMIGSSLSLYHIPPITGRFGQPEDVAGLVKFLALDPAASYITGQVCLAALLFTESLKKEPIARGLQICLSVLC